MAEPIYQHKENWSLTKVAVFTATIKEHFHVLTEECHFHLSYNTLDYSLYLLKLHATSDLASI